MGMGQGSPHRTCHGSLPTHECCWGRLETKSLTELKSICHVACEARQSRRHVRKWLRWPAAKVLPTWLSCRLTEVLKLLGFQSHARQILENWLPTHQEKNVFPMCSTKVGFLPWASKKSLCSEGTLCLDGENWTAVFWMLMSWIWSWQHLGMNPVHTPWADHCAGLFTGLCIAHICTHELDNGVCHFFCL